MSIGRHHNDAGAIWTLCQSGGRRYDRTAHTRECLHCLREYRNTMSQQSPQAFRGKLPHKCVHGAGNSQVPDGPAAGSS
jgi:hypothetical protein